MWPPQTDKLPLEKMHVEACMNIFSHADLVLWLSHWPHLSVWLNNLHMSSILALSVKWRQAGSALLSFHFLLSTCPMLLSWGKAFNVLYPKSKFGGYGGKKVRQWLARKLVLLQGMWLLFLVFLVLFLYNLYISTCFFSLFSFSRFLFLIHWSRKELARPPSQFKLSHYIWTFIITTACSQQNRNVCM